MKTKIDIIRETASFYNLNNRGVNTLGGCSYLTDSGTMCAVGRCMTNPTPTMFSSVKSLRDRVPGRGEAAELDLEAFLKPEYRGHDLDFWMDVQNLHDHAHNWDEEGLTEFGVAKVNQLLKKYILDDINFYY